MSESSVEHAVPSGRSWSGHRSSLRTSLHLGGTHWMLLGSLLAAGGAYVFQMLGARALGSRDYAPLGVLWTTQYLMLAILLYSIEAWAIRTMTLERGGTNALRSSLPRLLVAMTGVAATLSVVFWVGRSELLGGDGWLALVLLLNTTAYVAFVIVRAVLAARERFKSYGIVTALESVVRVVAVVPVIAMGLGARAVAFVMPVGAAAAAAYWLVARRTRKAPTPVPQASVADERPIQFLLATAPANAASQMLLAGGPLVLALLGDAPEATSIFFVAVTVARIPLVVAQGGLLSRMLPSFARMAAAGDRKSLTRFAVMTATGAVVAAAAAAAVWAVLGPPVLATLYGADFRPGSALAAGSIAGVVLCSGSLIINQLLVACRKERVLVAPWLGGLVAAVAIIVLLPTGIEGRVLGGFVIGQAVALAALAVTFIRLVPQLKEPILPDRLAM